jgi:alpha-2-macroglobulin
MKNAPWRKIGLISVTVILTLVLAFYFTKSKSARSYSASINPAFGEFISSYTAGVINSGSTVRIILAKDAVDSAAIGSETSVKLLEFSPSVQGITKWLDRRTLEFKPAVRLASGQIYEVRFAISKLFEMPSGLNTFEYSFQVIPQNFELSIENIKPYVKTELTRQRIEGIFFTSDYAEPPAVEQALQATQEGKLLNISWTHASEGKQHLFVIEDVARLDQASAVKLVAKGKSLGIDQSTDKEVEIPALGDFKVTNVKVDQNGNQHVVLQFSDPLNEKQNLEGLISISDLSNLDYEIEDNEVKVYPPVKQAGTKTLTVAAGIRNILNYRMTKASSFEVVFEQLKPAVRFTGKGSVLPSTDGLVMPFEAVNLKSVDLEVVKIYESNVLQFLQVNDFDGNEELRRVGKPVLKRTISLDNTGISDLGKWNRFTLDLSSFMSAEPGAIYQVRLSFKRAYLAYLCDEGEGTSPDGEESDIAEEDFSQGGDEETSNWDYYENNYYGGGYSWEQRDNPCNVSYYNNDRKIKRNLIASDLGLLAKRGGDGTTLVVVNDLKTTKPLSGVQVQLYDFQQQLIGSATTDSDGKVLVNSREIPFAMVAKNGRQRGYLKLQDGGSLSLSNFDVGGEEVRKGLKGFLYGERGVWRPGDSLYMSFILEDKLKLMPANHPVVFELQNPQGQVTNRTVRSTSENGFYKYATATSSDAPTGNWMVRAKVGGAEFTQPVKIEMVKPNRLKINLDFGVEKLTAASNNVAGNLTVNWLQGTPGKNLKAEFEVLLTKAETKFARYPDFTFDDPTRNFTSEAQQIFEGYTDDNGRAKVNANLQVTGAPGMLNAVFRGKVFEDGGNFSIDRFSLPFYPYESFTGIRLPPGDKARGMLLTDTMQRVDVLTLDAEGNGLSHDNIEMTIYKLEWRWWWDNSGDNEANFMSGQYSQPLQTGKIRTVNGKGFWDFKISYPEWGRYIVRALDPVSGHSTAKVVYIDWPNWAGRARGGNEGATMLAVSSDKATYNVGEKVNLVIPGSDHSRALVSVENGSRVIETFWVETEKGDNSFSFEATKDMTPNIFAHVTMLQPHDQTVNDLPIRLYGVVPLQIVDPETHLNPVIKMPDVLEPGQEVVIKVSEQAKKKMTYTLALVEEGLLDLTHYKTPDPWNRFYAREALGVKTWDLYNDVIGAFGGKLERLLAVGGDGVAEGKEDGTKANRFKPVVRFLGPFTLSGGGTNEHRITMPQYIGSVKTMVVAGYEGAYGKTDKATPVRKPLMVLATLPRVLGPEETLKLPITLFTMEPTIKNVKIEIKTSGPVNLPNGSSRDVIMNGSDMTVEFDLIVKSQTGPARIEVTASSGNNKATDVVEINVRNPNPPVTKVQSILLEAGKTWAVNVTPIGIAGTNSAVLEVSSLPPVNLGQRLKYLLQYPHGCIEQTTSSVFPQVYLDKVKVLTDGEKASINNNIKAAIERLKLFVTRDGGFAYWPGQEDSDSWGTTYAGHFLIEADAKGYFVPNEMIKRWKKFQRNKAQAWRKNQESYSSELIQAYRLYTLALTSDPELGAMNRLREQNDLPSTAAWMLAAAYAKVGQPEAARKLIATLPTKVKAYQEMAYSYGSDVRDKAIVLETLILLNDRAKGFEALKDISAALSNPNLWMSTQTIAWCLKSIGSFAGSADKPELKFSYTFNGKEISANTALPIAQVDLPLNKGKGGELKLVSSSSGALFARVISEGVPARGSEDEAAQNLALDVFYSDKDGNAIDPVRIEQGTSFIASVSVTNTGYYGNFKNLAINQIFPSGWEINNLRLDDAQDRLAGDKPTYMDIRDDRIYTYFDLNANQRKIFKVLLTASYAGSYYLPAVSAEAMYDHGVFALRKGKIVEVFKAVNP